MRVYRYRFPIELFTARPIPNSLNEHMQPTVKPYVEVTVEALTYEEGLPTAQAAFARWKENRNGN